MNVPVRRASRASLTASAPAADSDGVGGIAIGGGDPRARQRLLGRCAGVLFLAGAFASAPANQLLSNPEPGWYMHLTDALAFISGVICLLIPWHRISGAWLHAIPFVATSEIVLTASLLDTHGEVYLWYFLLGAVFIGFAFRRRVHVAAHMLYAAVGFCSVAYLARDFDPDALVRCVVAVPTLWVAAGVVAWLREGLESREQRMRDMAAERQREAHTDSLTGLGNRRALMADLEHALTAGRRQTFALFDLDGFKLYNDRFGHPAGDELLRRLGERLAETLGGAGEAYRLGGDEFCVLLDRTGLAGVAAVSAASEALSEHGSGFHIAASTGIANLPDEATEVSQALSVADGRMYADKQRRKRPSRDGTAVLKVLQEERAIGLGVPVPDLAELARSTGRRLGLDAEDIDVTVRAAELHDIGKAAIPDAILDKPGPLDEDEWAFVRRHAEIGERILAAAGALRPVARLVRHSHERFDGSGYPDGLAGDEIPLGARIIAVCDAYHAMTVRGRAYDSLRSAAEAAAELRGNAGSQFDGAVVEAFLEALAEDGTAPAWVAMVRASSSPSETETERETPTVSATPPEIPPAS